MGALQGHERGVVVQPSCLLVSERVQSGPIFRRRAATEAIECLPQQGPLECPNLVVLDVRVGERRSVVEASGIEEAISRQPREGDEQLVTGEGGRRRVGRVSQSGWAKRQ